MPLLREVPLLRETVPPEVPREAVEEAPRTVEVPDVRTAEVPRDALDVERATPVMPEERRAAEEPLREPESVEPPVRRVTAPELPREARETDVPRPEAPPRETKLRELRDASLWPTWRAWLLSWWKRPFHPPIP